MTGLQVPGGMFAAVGLSVLDAHQADLEAVERVAADIASKGEAMAALVDEAVGDLEHDHVQGVAPESLACIGRL